jgi:hypothetical protein
VASATHGPAGPSMMLTTPTRPLAGMSPTLVIIFLFFALHDYAVTSGLMIPRHYPIWNISFCTQHAQYRRFVCGPVHTAFTGGQSKIKPLGLGTRRNQDIRFLCIYAWSAVWLHLHILHTTGSAEGCCHDKRDQRRYVVTSEGPSEISSTHLVGAYDTICGTGTGICGRTVSQEERSTEEIPSKKKTIPLFRTVKRQDLLVAAQLTPAFPQRCTYAIRCLDEWPT